MSVLNVAAAVFQPVGLGNQLCNHSMYDFFLMSIKICKDYAIDIFHGILSLRFLIIVQDSFKYQRLFCICQFEYQMECWSYR